jgi:pimeloyl-ACP methyl ester carboxylesterase
VLVGHSDGASIALIHGGSGTATVVAGMVLEAPHVFAEELSLDSIAAAAQTFRTDNLRERLAKHHADPDGAFWGWNGAWLNPEFRQWNLEEFLPGIRVPLLLVQGREDPYGTSRQLEAIQRGCATPVSTLLLAGCGHAPHRDQPEMVLAAVTGFVRELERPKDP